MINRHIDRLMEKHDCVVVPGLGAVLARRRPASYDSATGVWTPPNRTFAFNQDLKETDGLIAASVARDRLVSYENAIHIVEGRVKAIKQRLADGESVALGHAGTLAADASGALHFTPSTDGVLSPDYRWLAPVSVPLIADAVRAADAAAGNVSASGIHPWVRRVKIAAMIAVLLAVGAAFTLPIALEHVSTATLSPFVASTSAPKPEAPIIKRPGQVSTPLMIVLSEAEDAATVVDTVEYRRQRAEAMANPVAESEPVVPVKLAESDADRYCLVIGSVATQADADRFIANNSDLNIGILRRDGRIRLYMASAPTSAELTTIAAKMGDRFPGAWVCRK